MINQCLEKGDSAEVVPILQSPNFNLRVAPECAETYYSSLLEAKNQNAEGNTLAWSTLHNRLNRLKCLLCIRKFVSQANVNICFMIIYTRLYISLLLDEIWSVLMIMNGWGSQRCFCECRGWNAALDTFFLLLPSSLLWRASSYFSYFLGSLGACSGREEGKRLCFRIATSFRILPAACERSSLIFWLGVCINVYFFNKKM